MPLNKGTKPKPEYTHIYAKTQICIDPHTYVYICIIMQERKEESEC